MTTNNNTSSQVINWMTPIQLCLPVFVGVIPVGISFGVLSEQAGLSILHVALLSLIVFAGSSQFIALALLSTGASIVSIIITTFFINLRHLFMSSALSLHVQQQSKLRLWFFGFSITDETFALNLRQFETEPWTLGQATLLSYTFWATWGISSFLGFFLGNLPWLQTLDLSFVLTAMLMGLLAFQLKSHWHWFVMLVSGLLSAFFSQFWELGIAVIPATLIASTLGFALKQWRSHDTE